MDAIAHLQYALKEINEKSPGIEIIINEKTINVICPGTDAEYVANTVDELYAIMDLLRRLSKFSTDGGTFT